MKRSVIYAITLLIIILGSCKRNRYWKARDFIYEKKLTSNVRGIACVSGRSVFVMGYGKNGTIGIVDSLGQSDQYFVLPAKGEGNAIRFDKKWNMYIADSVNRSILLMKSGERSVNVFAKDSTVQGMKLLAVTSQGVLFTIGTEANGDNLESATQNGVIKKLESGIGLINGIEVSPGDKYLYINEAKQRKILRYSLDTAGNVSGKTEFYTFQDDGLAGMRCDTAGNLFVCRPGKSMVAVIAPDGKLLREVKLKGKNPSDIAFGGYDGKSVLVTTQDRGVIETFKSEIPGREWDMFRR